jgi:anti-sigma regulatory factor (Ser/Thr protein kinase)
MYDSARSRGGVYDVEVRDHNDDSGQFVTAVFPGTPASAGVARRFVQAALGRWQVDARVMECAALLTSELVTNTYRHADSEARVTVSHRAGVVRVEVHDTGEGRIQVLPLDPSHIEGRGLQIVDTLASRWGNMTSEGGTLVWFELQSTPL